MNGASFNSLSTGVTKDMTEKRHFKSKVDEKVGNFNEQVKFLKSKSRGNY